MVQRVCSVVVALVVVALVGVGSAPLVTRAQEATPAAGTGDRTDVRYVLPFTPDGLHPALTATATAEGVCGFPSSGALDRPDAWDCLGADEQIYDPCFENPFLPPDEPGQVACFASPFSTDVVVLTLTAPLEREKEAPAVDPTGDPGSGQGTGPGPSTGAGAGPSTGAGAGPSTGVGPVMSLAQAAAVSIEAWDLPWALELANGEQCTLLGGTLTVQAGQTVHYGCADGGTILGEVQHRQSVWTVHYLAEGAVASQLVAVVAAWS